MVFVTIITRASLSQHQDDTMPVTNTIERELYPSQTKILEGLTKDEIQIFDIIFTGSYPK
jgi:hypothetical protein